MVLSVAQFAQVSDWFATGTPKTITGLAWSSGDVIVVITGGESGTDVTAAVPTNANLTFGAAQATAGGGTGTEASIWVYRATAAGAQTGQTISIARTGNLASFGGCAWVITGSPTGTANPTANLNESATSRTVGAGSVVIYGHMDFNATNPQGKTPATGSGSATERRDAGDGSNYGQYMCEWVGTAAGTFSFGTNNYTSLQVSQAIIEVLAPVAATKSPPFRRRPSGLLVR